MNRTLYYKLSDPLPPTGNWICAKCGSGNYLTAAKCVTCKVEKH